MTSADTDLATALFTGPQVARYVCDLGTAKSVTQEMQTLIRRGAGRRIGIWSASSKDSGEKIGTCILLPLPITVVDTDWSLVVADRYPDAEIEIGHMLRPAALGCGFATIIYQRLARFGFEKTSLTEIMATTDPENAASQHVLLPMKDCATPMQPSIFLSD